MSSDQAGETDKIKLPPTSETKFRAQTISYGGFASTTSLTLIVAYGFKIADSLVPGFETPIEAMGPEVGATIYGGIAAGLTSIWQHIAAKFFRETITERRGPDRDTEHA
jgi:hypothetical protein